MILTRSRACYISTDYQGSSYTQARAHDNGQREPYGAWHVRRILDHIFIHSEAKQY